MLTVGKEMSDARKEGQVSILNREVRVGISEKVPLELRPSQGPRKYLPTLTGSCYRSFKWEDDYQGPR